MEHKCNRCMDTNHPARMGINGNNGPSLGTLYPNISWRINSRCGYCTYRNKWIYVEKSRKLIAEWIGVVYLPFVNDRNGYNFKQPSNGAIGWTKSATFYVYDGMWLIKSLVYHIRAKNSSSILCNWFSIANVFSAESAYIHRSHSVSMRFFSAHAILSILTPDSFSAIFHEIFRVIGKISDTMSNAATDNRGPVRLTQRCNEFCARVKYAAKSRINSLVVRIHYHQTRRHEIRNTAS